MNGMCALCAATACTNNKEFNTLKIRCREKFINTSECVDLCNNFYNIDLIHRLIMQSAVQSAFRCAFSRAHTFTHCQADRISFIRKDNFSWAFSVFFFAFPLSVVLNSFNLQICVYDAMPCSLSSIQPAIATLQPTATWTVSEFSKCMQRTFTCHVRSECGMKRDGKMNWNCLKPTLTVSYYYTLCQEWKKVDIISISVVIIIIGRRVWF